MGNSCFNTGENASAFCNFSRDFTYMFVPRQILPDSYALEFRVFRVIYIGTSDSNVVCESTKPKRLFIVKNYKVAFVNVDREFIQMFPMFYFYQFFCCQFHKIYKGLI